MVGKLKAAMEAKMEFDPDFVIMARCDFGGVPGATFEEIIAQRGGQGGRGMSKRSEDVGRDPSGDTAYPRASGTPDPSQYPALSYAGATAGSRCSGGLVPGVNHYGRAAGQLGLSQ